MDTPDTPNRIRRYRLKLYPTKEQADRLQELRLICGDLQNACIERYQAVYSREHRTLRQYELSKEITAVRAACPEWQAFPAMTPHLVYGRVQLAYQSNVPPPARWRNMEHAKVQAPGYEPVNPACRDRSAWLDYRAA